MSFNLENYILNEALSSNILRSILNEPSGFFKLSKLFSLSVSPEHKKGRIDNGGVHDISSDIYEIIRNLSITMSTLFWDKNYYLRGKIDNHNYYNSSERVHADHPEALKDNWMYNTGAETVEFTWDDLVDTQYNNITDQEKIRINKEYNQQIKELYSKFQNLLKRPDPFMFNLIVNHDRTKTKHGFGIKDIRNLDLMSIMDSNFKKLTFAELKKDEHAQEDLQNNRVKNVGLYFNKAGYFLGASSLGMVFLKNNFITWDDSENVQFIPLVDKINDIIKEPDFYIPKALLKTPLADSKRYLYWPVLSTVNYVNDTIDRIFHTSGKYGHLNIVWDDMFLTKQKSGFQYVSTNKIISAASNLRLILQWGYDKNDYVIIYKPEHDLNMLEYDTETYTSNTTARNNIRQYRKDQRNTKGMAPESMYRFKKDSLFKTMPYRVGSKKQTVTVYDYVLNKFINLNTETGDPSEYFNKDYKKEKVYFCSNYDEFVDLARTNLLKRKIQFSVLKSILKTGNELSQRIYDSQIGIAERMKKCDDIALFIRQHFKEISKEDISNLNMLIFKTDFITGNELRKVTDLLNETEKRKILSDPGMRPFAGIQNEMNKFIIMASEANMKLNNVIDYTERQFKHESISEYSLNHIQDEAKKQLNDIFITYYINFDNIDLYFKICDKILEKYK